MHRAALGLSATRVPLFLMLAAGALLGPHGAAVLTPSALDALQPLVPVALAGLGVLLGVGLDVRSWREARLLDAGSLEATVTMLAIAGSYIAAAGTAAADLPVAIAAVLLAACGGPSSSHPASYSQSAAGTRALRLIDFDDVMPVVVAAVAVTAGAAHAALADVALVLLKAGGVGAA